MQNRRKKILYWLPRIVAILFILFISMFAFDVFSEYSLLGEILVALFMHLVPSFFLVAAAVIAWRWPIVGGVLFIVLGLFSVVFFNTYDEVLSLLLISTPPVILGLLFIRHGWHRLQNGGTPEQLDDVA